MKVLLVTALEGKGLQVDAELIADFLKSLGHESDIVSYTDPPPTTKFDLGISFEVVNTHYFASAFRWMWFPNCEWTKPQMLRDAARFDLVLAKTHAAYEAFRPHFANVVYTGFLTRDQLDSSVPRERKFLHVGGNGGFRNTDKVISAWREYRYWLGSSSPSAPLTVVSNSTTVSCVDTPDIQFIKRASDEELRRLQNSHLFHIFPSAYEGWGHALHEALSVGAMILTTDIEPMSDVGTPFVVPSIAKRQHNLAILHDVDPAAIRSLVPEMLAGADAWLAADHRVAFDVGNLEFRKLFMPLLTAQPASTTSVRVLPKRNARIVILGNFDQPHSTENDLLWTLTDMGHQVYKAQENKTCPEEIFERASGFGFDLLIYVHTHGYVSPGTMSLDELWDGLKAKGIRTCSFHLDRYWGLNALDRREDLIGQHPFWHTEKVFTADGGEHDWAGRGVNHFWLPPGVVKRDCVPGNLRSDLATDVGFVGARGYHPEYPFRSELISFLESTYGDRFRLFQGYRGQALNDLYASIKVVVGDSCFAGADRYWSDRVPETLGRGGFLIHPATCGLTIPGLVTFEPQNLSELKYRIDYYTNYARNGTEREGLRKSAWGWVVTNETYHNRMTTLLSVMGVS